MRVRFTPRARNDLKTILDYLDQRSPQGARNVKLALFKTVKLIGRYPECGRLAGEEMTRVLPVARYPYLVYWSVAAGQASIVHLRHARRRPWEGNG